MLIIKRRVDQRLRIGDDVLLTVLAIDGGSVTLGLEAPREVVILRDELRPIQQENEQAGRSRL